MGTLNLAIIITSVFLGTFPSPSAINTTAETATAAETATTAVVSGVLRDVQSLNPVPGRIILLGGAQRVATGADGSFRFEAVETGVYRLIVPGSCDAVPPRVDAKPGEAIEVEVLVDTACAPTSRLVEPGGLPPAARFTPWPVAIADGAEAADLVRPPIEVVAEAVGPDSSLRAVIASPHGIRNDMRRLIPIARPKAAGGEDYVVLIEPGCFAPSVQVTLTADGAMFMRLLGSPLDGPDAPVLRRQVCKGCVERLFADLRRAGFPALSGIYAFPRPDLGERTLAGVVHGQPFLVRTSGINLAPVEAFRTRILDICAYASCIDQRDMQLFDVDLKINAPDSVMAGGEFEVRARASAHETLAGAALRLEVDGATWISGGSGKTGMVEPASPLVVSARYRVPRIASWERGAREVVVRARFAAEYGVPLDPEGAVQTRRIRVR